MDNLFSTTGHDPTDYCRVCEEETDVDLDVLQCTKVALCYECGTAYDADDEEVIYNLWGVISDKEMELKEDVEQKHVSIGLFKRLTEWVNELRLRGARFDCSRCQEKTEVAEFPRGVSPAEICCHECYMPYQHSDNESRINWMYDRVADLNKRICEA